MTLSRTPLSVALRPLAVGLAATAVVGLAAAPAQADVQGSFSSLTSSTGTLKDFSANSDATILATATLSCPNGGAATAFLTTPGTELPSNVSAASDAYNSGYLAVYMGDIQIVKGKIVPTDAGSAQLAYSMTGWLNKDYTQGDLIQFMMPGTTYSLGFACWHGGSGSVDGKLAAGADGTPIVSYGTLTVQALPAGQESATLTEAQKEALTWTFTAPAPVKHAVTPALTASASGQTVTLSASVPSAATGTVEFFDGSTSVGTATVSNGAASLVLSGVAEGQHSYTAAYSGDSAYAAGTSAAQSVTVTKPTVPPVDTTVTVTLPQASAGQLTLTGAAAASLGTATQQSDNSFAATGQLGTVTVVDSRASKAAWSLSGQASAFSGPSGASLPASSLGWTPAVDTGATLPAGVTAGAAAASLASSQPLATAAASASQAVLTSKLNAGLSFTAPAGTTAGSYTTTLQLTLI